MGAPWLTAHLAAITSSLGALGLLVDVTHEAWIGDANDYSKPSYDVPRTLRAEIQWGTSQARTINGETVVPRARLSFLEAVAPNGAPNRFEPFDPRDRLTFTYEGVEIVGGPIVEAVGSQLVTQAAPIGSSRSVHNIWLK